MKYLLDTHIVIWIAENSNRLTERMKEVLLDDASEKYVSIVSAWEAALKFGTGKLTIQGGLEALLDEIDKNGFILLPVEREHVSGVLALPHHHKDPFDRLLVATAIAENMTLITVDENIHKYAIPYLS
jgi:PIN domain nuclease of toxin-antitoxin system